MIKAVLIAAGFAACSVLAETPVEKLGHLQVKHNKIVGSDGQPAVVRGMSLFWSHWQGQYFNRQVVNTLARDWQCSLVRAPLAIKYKGYLRNSDRELAKMEEVIEAAIDNGIYVIVDWHDHSAFNHRAEARKFFEYIAQKYGTHPNIIYEIFNEPLAVSWQDTIVPYAEFVIEGIRKHDPDNLIVVGTRDWSQRVTDVIGHEIDDPNVAYTLHFYAGSHHNDLRSEAQRALDAGIPLFVTEWGAVNADGNGAVDHHQTQLWIEWMERNQISWANWAISDKREGASALKSRASRRGEWSENDLTESGVLVRNYLRTR